MGTRLLRNGIKTSLGYCVAFVRRMNSVYRLPHRCVVKVQGRDAVSLLQGLLTNDVEVLNRDGAAALYAHALNLQGRTLYDLILYSVKSTPGTGRDILLECDSAVKDSLQRHLKMYKIRREVDIRPCEELAVWAVLPQEGTSPKLRDPQRVLAWEQDPRTEAMGWRLVVEQQVTPEELLSDCRRGETEEYHRHRYTLGVPEGVKDLPPRVALPLESNLVYLRGISFTKGCYLGQELTARSHHTGVIRKRLMPVCISGPPSTALEGAELKTQTGKPAGRHVSSLGEVGLSLVRLVYAAEPLVLEGAEGGRLSVQPSVPHWWPRDTAP